DNSRLKGCKEANPHFGETRNLFGKYIEDARLWSSNGQKMANPLKFVRYSGVNGQNMENLLKSVRYPGVNGQKMANPLKFVRYPSVNGQNMENPLKSVRHPSVNGHKMANHLKFARYPSVNGQKMANLLKSVRYSGVNGQKMANLSKSVRYSGVNGQNMENLLKSVRYPSVNGQTMANLLKSVHNLCSPSQSASHYMLEINFQLLTKIHLKGVLLMKHTQTPYDIGDKQKFANRKLSQSKYDVVHIHLKKAEEIKTHHAKEETLIVVRSGKIRMKIEAETVEL